jgi:hypothetical protein
MRIEHKDAPLSLARIVQPKSTDISEAEPCRNRVFWLSEQLECVRVTQLIRVGGMRCPLDLT